MSDLDRLPPKLRERLEASWAGTFYREVFVGLDEEPFAVLYGVALRRYVGLSKPIVGLAFVPGGRSLLIAADTDAVHEWRVDATQDDLLAWIAANRYLPELTCQQRQRYRIKPIGDEAGVLRAVDKP